MPKAAGVSGLVYVSDEMPGFTRVAAAKGFRYRDTRGKAITDKDEIQRINKLAIPPAYTDVWICAVHNGHLQATGRDARGRKQYRYHPDWQVQRNDGKFDRLEAFGRALPRIRARVTRDLKPARGQPLGRTLVLATMVRLLDTTFVRVGNDEYARENGSYGLTTLRNPHAGVRGKTLRLRFRGKSGVLQDLKVDDPKVAAVVRRCQQLPGQALFQYEDEDGEVHGIGSTDVNNYLAELTGEGKGRTEHFTAKDFRTWHGTAQALELTRLACSSLPPDEQAAAETRTGQASKVLAKSKAPGYSVKAVLAEVASLLGNTPAVCKKSYIHPAVMALGTELSKDAAAMNAMWDKLDGGQKTRRLHAAEHRLLGFLKTRRQKLKVKPGARAA
ncbi:MAG: DNA topoisomerase IB [Polaromonas sp.]|nr:DNA topoisomerase IB [Polaromonas sp.]